MIKSFSNNLFNTRVLSIFMLGFASGLPFMLSGSTLQMWLTDAHIDLMTISMLSFVGLPYILKFLWAPILDQYSFKWFGKRKAWICITQICLIFSLIGLAVIDPARSIQPVWMLALAIAFFSASQDVAITAYQTDVLETNERGLGAAYYVAGYRLAILFAGGIALVIADYTSWRVTYLCMALTMLCCFLLTMRTPTPREEPADAYLLKTIMHAWQDLIKREQIILVLVFIILYKFGDALALQLMSYFLRGVLGFSKTELGLAYKTIGFVAMMAGGFVGGAALLRMNLYRALIWFGIAQAFSNLSFMVLALLPKSFFLMSSAIFIENFCSGLSTAALLALMMTLCNHRYSATQFSLLSAAASLGRVALGPLAGSMVEHLGWAQFYWWSFVLSFPAIILLFYLGEIRILAYAEAN